MSKKHEYTTQLVHGDQEAEDKQIFARNGEVNSPPPMFLVATQSSSRSERVLRLMIVALEVMICFGVVLLWDILVAFDLILAGFITGL